MPHVVFRSGVVFGEDDDFTNTLALLLHAAPVFPLPRDGDVMLHPLWVEDLAAALVLLLETQPADGRVLAAGGAEHLSLREIALAVAATVGLRRAFVGVVPAYMRHLIVWLRYLFPGLPVSPLWMDYFAADRIAPPDVLPREFGLMPERFSRRLGYLRGVPWRRRLLQVLFARNRSA